MSIVTFHTYVSLPEGKLKVQRIPSKRKPMEFLSQKLSLVHHQVSLSWILIEPKTIRMTTSGDVNLITNHQGYLYCCRFRCRLKPNMLICNVFALFFCYVNPVASHVCDVNPGVVWDSVQSQWEANILTSEAQIKANQTTPRKNTRRHDGDWTEWMNEWWKQCSYSDS